MLAGFAAATLGLQMPFVEPAIWSSVIILGLLVALAIKAPVWLGAAMTGLFAFFHGHIHGAEAVSGNLTPYVAGFSLATVGLLAAGIWLGFFAERSIGKMALRAMGGLTALGGIVLIAG
jgi:urease accessory protein